MVERELLSKLKHPGIVQLHYTFQDTDTLYFIMEYCEGGSFTEFIKLNYNKLTNEIKVFYVAQVVMILEFLHRHGITHRDLKVLLPECSPKTLCSPSMDISNLLISGLLKSPVPTFSLNSPKRRYKK